MKLITERGKDILLPGTLRYQRLGYNLFLSSLETWGDIQRPSTEVGYTYLGTGIVRLVWRRDGHEPPQEWSTRSKQPRVIHSATDLCGITNCPVVDFWAYKTPNRGLEMHWPPLNRSRTVAVGVGLVWDRSPPEIYCIEWAWVSTWAESLGTLFLFRRLGAPFCPYEVDLMLLAWFFEVDEAMSNRQSFCVESRFSYPGGTMREEPDCRRAQGIDPTIVAS